MDDKWGLAKVLLLLIVAAVWIFTSVQIDRSQEEMIQIRKHLEGQGTTLQELSVAQKRLQQELIRFKDKLSSGITVASKVESHRLDPEGWVPDGLILSHGKNCLLPLEDIPAAFPEAKESEELNLVLQVDFNDMNLLLDNSGDLLQIANNILMPLYSQEFMQDGEKWFSNLAKTLRITNDYTTYTLELRDDFYWHMPAVDLNDPKFKWLRDLGRQPMTAHDMVFTVRDIILNPNTECDVSRTYFKKLERIEALDDHTVQLTWKEKTYPSKTWSAIPTIIPKYLYSRYENGREIPSEVLGEEFNRHWYNDKIIGCGPYRFVSYEKGKRVVLERDENYPLKKPHFKRIVYHIVKNPDQQLARFLRGEIDFIQMRANQYASQIHRLLEDESAQQKSPFYFPGKESFQFNWEKVPFPGYSYVGWNQKKEFFKDPKVRRAMTLAMPIKKMLKDVWMGIGTECTGPILLGSPGYDESIEAVPYDPEQAARLLDEAGWIDRDQNGIREKKLENGEVVELEFEVMHFSPLPEYDQMFALYRKELKKIGVSCKGLGLDWPNMIKRLEEKDFDAVAMAWALGYETDPYQIFHSSQADNPKGSNRISFKSDEVDDIIVTARKTFDPEKRKDLFRRWHRIFYDEQIYTIWRGSMHVYAWNEKLRGVRFDARRPLFRLLDWWRAQN